MILNATKRLCRGKYRYAVKVGKLIRPDRCEGCGDDSGQIDGHHHDYTKPYEVEWLCKPCHREADRRSEIAYWTAEAEKLSSA